MADEIQIVPYDPARKAEVAELLNICLGEKTTGCRDADYWSWKHEQNSFGKSVMLLAECDSRLVGVRAFMRWRLTCHGTIVEAAKPVDTVTHPDYQRRGIFSRLTTQACDEARDAGVHLIFNTPNSNSKPGYLKLGWREVADLPVYAKWLRPASAVWNVVRSKLGDKPAAVAEDFFRRTPAVASEVLGESRQLDQLLNDRQAAISGAASTSPSTLLGGPRGIRLPGRRTNESSQMPSRAANASDPPSERVRSVENAGQPESTANCDMVSEVSDEVRRTGGAEERVGNSVDRLKTQRDASFLRWRYGQHPHIQYYAESVGPDANPDGLLLYRTNLRSGLREIMIDDMFARERKYDVRNALLDQLCSRVDAHYVVAHAADGSPLLQSLRRFGFRRVPRRRITLVAKSLTDELQPDPFREANWSLCLGDIEGL